jgi:hypothetical protein
MEQVKAGADEQGYLVERTGASDPWWTGRGAVFTKDSVDALRLARQRDGDTIIQTLTCLSGCVVTPHVWTKAGA